MNNIGTICRCFSVLFFVFLQPPLRAEQFVKITAEMDQHKEHFSAQKIPDVAPHQVGRFIFTPSQVYHFTVGKNKWCVEGCQGTLIRSYWFTGTNMVEAWGEFSKEPEQGSHSHTGTTNLYVNWTLVRLHQSNDGNPSRPIRVADLMSFTPTARLGWLAFCSGTALKTEGRVINPPDDMWKEFSDTWGWSDKVALLGDELGLPKSVNLINKNNQSFFQYRVRSSTNFMGWSIPLTFYAVQFNPSMTNGWEQSYTVRGRVTSISEGSEPFIPNEVLKMLKQ
jgi:hypothetical protein